MRRRKLFTLAAGVSAVFFVAASLLWAGSYWGWGGYEWMLGDRWHGGAKVWYGDLIIWDRAVFEPATPTSPIRFDLALITFEQRGDRMNRARELLVRCWGLA